MDENRVRLWRAITRFRRRSPRGFPRPLAALMLIVSVAACTPGPLPVENAQPQAESPLALTVANYRRGAGTVASGGASAPYNYGPTVVEDQGRYRAWWCSQLPGVGPPGDDLLHAESADPNGEFSAPSGASAVPVFHGQPGAFDGTHTCDPSVLKVNGRYYLYYTGARGEHARGNSIGVASSADGVAWRRESDGKPIVRPSHEVARSNVYGAGQPSAVYLDGWYYLMFTDTTARGAGWNGAGQFVLRAKNPEFSREVETLTDSGFVPGSSVRPRSIVDAFSADWMWVEALGAFAIAHQTEFGTNITFWDRTFTRHPYRRVLIPGPWQEGPGLVRQENGHAPVSSTRPCDVVPIDLLRATTTPSAPSNIHHFGTDITGVNGCERPDQARSVLNGFAVPSPKRTVDIVHRGKKIRIERRSVAEGFVRRMLEHRPPALDKIPVAASISSEAPALVSPSGQYALMDDRGRLWTVDHTAVEKNASVPRAVGQQEWDSYAHGGDLT